MQRPCIVQGCTSYTMQTRCAAHAIPAYSHAERARMRAAVLQHRLTHGAWCPGYLVPPHPSADLTADHVVPRAHGGMTGPLAVLCRQCNTRKADH